MLIHPDGEPHRGDPCLLKEQLRRLHGNIAVIPRQVIEIGHQGDAPPLLEGDGHHVAQVEHGENVLHGHVGVDHRAALYPVRFYKFERFAQVIFGYLRARLVVHGYNVGARVGEEFNLRFGVLNH